MVYTVENYREDLGTLGVDEAVLVATPIHGNESPYTLDCLRTYPDTFHGIVLLDYGAEDVANQIAEAMALENVIGVGLMHDELYEANPDLWSALAEHNGQVQFLVDPPALSEIEPLAADHPGVQFVVDHLGMASGVDDQAPGDAPYATMADLSAHSNVMVKLTHTPSAGPYPFEDIHEHVRFLLEAFGSDRRPLF